MPCDLLISKLPIEIGFKSYSVAAISLKDSNLSWIIEVMLLL